MNCAVCAAPAEPMLHHFLVGAPENPDRRWVVMAPLYCRMSADNTECERPYCSAACATKDLGAR